jgi:outer membrane protein assembly factor BamB
MTPDRSKRLSLLVASLLVPLFGIPSCTCKPGNSKDPQDAGGCTGTICAVTGIPEASGLNFGNVPIGQPISKTLTLQNAGTALLNVTGASISGGSVDGGLSQYRLGVKLGPQIQQSGSATTTITFTPAAAGTQNATLVILTDGDPGTLNVPLTGVGIDVEICAHPTTIDFGNVQVLGTPELTGTGSVPAVSICNCGLSPVALTFPGIQGPQAADFGDTGESNATLAPGSNGSQGQCENITISYSPAALGPSTADLPYGICTGCPTQSINLTGVGVDGQLTFSPSPVNFGAPPAGSAPTQQVTATNTGTENLVLVSMGTFSGSNVFALTGVPTLPLTMAPLQNFTFTVTYNTSGMAGGDSDELLGVFSVADPLVPDRTAKDLLSGNQSLNPCQLNISPTSVNFGLVSDNQVGTRQVTLTNSGSTACAVSAIALSPSTDPYFGLGAAQAASLSVLPGSSQQITVTFSPTSTTAPLTRTGQLTFQTGDTTNPSATVPLSATIQGASVYSGGWPKWHLDNFNSGQSGADTSGDQGVVAWKYNIGTPGGSLGSFGGGTYINSPVVSTVTGVMPAPAAGYIVYQMDINGTLHALSGGTTANGGGTQLWQQKLQPPGGDTHPSTPAVLSDGSMFVATNSDGTGAASLYYISNTGAVTFSEPFGEDGFDSCPALGQNGTLFMADDDGASPASGACGGSGGGDPYSALAFTANAGSVSQIGGLALPLTAESERFGVVVAADDTSYWGNNGQFFAISPPPAFGLVAAWPSCGVTLAGANLTQNSSGAVSDLALDSLTTGYLLAYSAWENYGTVGNGLSVQGNIAALDPATGVQEWIFNMPDTALPSSWSGLPSDNGNAAPAVALDGTVYVGNGNGLYALNGSTGAKNWLFSTANVSSSPAIGADGTIFFGCDDGNFYAVTALGALRFKITTGGPISSSPAIAPDGTVYFVSDDGNLYAID